MPVPSSSAASVQSSSIAPAASSSVATVASSSNSGQVAVSKSTIVSVQTSLSAVIVSSTCTSFVSSALSNTISSPPSASASASGSGNGLDDGDLAGQVWITIADPHVSVSPHDPMVGAWNAAGPFAHLFSFHAWVPTYLNETFDIDVLGSGPSQAFESQTQVSGIVQYKTKLTGNGSARSEYRRNRAARKSLLTHYYRLRLGLRRVVIKMGCI